MIYPSLLMRPTGSWCYRCRFCNEVFTSSQGLAGHQTKHRFEDTWIKGAHHHKFFSPSADLPLHCRYLGYLMSDSIVIRNQERLRHPPMRNSVVQSPIISLSDRRSSFNPLQQSMVLEVPPQPQGHPQHSYHQSQQQHTMIQVTQQAIHGQTSYTPNPPQQRAHQLSHYCMTRGDKEQIPHVNAHEPITPTLNQNNIQRLSQLAQYEIQLNLNGALAGRPLELTHSSIGSTSEVTAGWMCEKKNDDHEVEELDLELRL
ncbi:hypothetical protein H5410_016219 [Solanum commersonii]|uniref:C2H2-type domain-containing protein n=1 Tax=Solanum commersonii TaxID=4109 RepID=A0A9J5ZWE3_SOLCO|nr:hypothetical protein H5410_016219 [Solanum commersonii]